MWLKFPCKAQSPSHIVRRDPNEDLILMCFQIADYGLSGTLCESKRTIDCTLSGLPWDR